MGALPLFQRQGNAALGLKLAERVMPARRPERPALERAMLVVARVCEVPHRTFSNKSPEP